MLTGEKGPQTQHRTTTFDKAIDVWENHFKDLSQPLNKEDYLGKTVVDIDVVMDGTRFLQPDMVQR